MILGSSELSGSAPRNGNAYVAKLNASGDVTETITFGDNKVDACRIFKIDNQTFLLGGSKNVGTSSMDFEFWLQILSESN